MLAQIILSEMEKALPSIGTACPEEDKYKDKGTHTQIKTNTKCFQDPMYAIFIKSRGLKDLKYYIGCLLVMTKTKTRFYALLGLNIFQW